MTIEVNSVIFALNGKIKEVCKHFLFSQVDPHTSYLPWRSVTTGWRSLYESHTETICMWKNLFRSLPEHICLVNEADFWAATLDSLEDQVGKRLISLCGEEWAVPHHSREAGWGPGRDDRDKQGWLCSVILRAWPLHQRTAATGNWHTAVYSQNVKETYLGDRNYGLIWAFP